MKQTFNIEPFLKESVKQRVKELKISMDHFWNLAGQNLYNMSKTKLPEANDIKGFEHYINHEKRI